MALAELKIKALASTDKAFWAPDANNLYLYVNTSFSKLWYFRYQAKGRRTYKALGRCPEVSLKKGREAASEARKIIDSGAESAEAPKIAAFKDAANEWFKTFKGRYIPREAKRKKMFF